jgi:hypothetical protein
LVTLRAPTIRFILIASFGLALCERATEATNPSNTRSYAAENKFLGHWSSHITYSSGEQVNDGGLDITEVSSARADRVSVLHSVRGGPFIGYTMSYPDRIEIQMPLGDGRVVHYNGVLVAADRIEGRFFVTGDRRSHHSHKRSKSSRASGEDEGTWTGTQP